MWVWSHMGGGWGWVIMSLLFWALIIGTIVWAVSASSRRGSDAMSILEERYARGEITRQEFEERRDVLKGRRRE